MQEIVLTAARARRSGPVAGGLASLRTGAPTPLAELIHEKTAGNPFFAIQFISALADEGLLSFDYGRAALGLGPGRIHAKGFTDNIVELMVGKLNRLPAETQEALQQFACMGNSAEFEMLRMVYQGSVEEHAGRSVGGRAVGLILVADDSYRFLHDRVQEAAYSLIPKRSARRGSPAHRHAARRAHTSGNAKKPSSRSSINSIAAAHLIASVEERERVAELNLIAGRRAKTSTAYDVGVQYLRAGTSLS